MEQQATNAKWQALHNERPWHNGTWSSWAEKRSNSHPYHRDAGITFGVSDTNVRPDDRFLSTENCGPLTVESPEANPDEAPTSPGF